MYDLTVTYISALSILIQIGISPCFYNGILHLSRLALYVSFYRRYYVKSFLSVSTLSGVVSLGLWVGEGDRAVIGILERFKRKY